MFKKYPNASYWFAFGVLAATALALVASIAVTIKDLVVGCSKDS
jgi:hypothetical protein